MVFYNFLGDKLFFGRNPKVVAKGDLLVFGPVLGRGPGSKTEKHNFPELWALLGKKPVRPKSFSPKLRIFFTFCVLADQPDRTPRGGKSQNTGFLGPFGLGQPLALREIPDQKQENTISQS